MTVGVLALQGDFAEHLQILEDLGVEGREVRTAEDLAAVDRLIIPGGESTVMDKLLWESGLAKAIIKRVRRGMPIYGTCAGAILLAKKIGGKNAPHGLSLLNITIERNAYGEQNESFAATLTIKNIGKVPVAFIRAPKITKVGWRIDALAEHKGSPVLVRRKNILAGTFHPEVRGESGIHRFFLSL